MEKKNVITLWSIVYIVDKYHTLRDKTNTKLIIQELQSNNNLKFNLKSRQIYLLDLIFIDLECLIKDVYEYKNSQLNGINDKEKIDKIIDLLKLNGNKPVITIMDNLKCEIDYYIF